MKKIIFSFFALPFIAHCFCVTLHAQSSDNDLDQRELAKQFIGKWITEIGQDTTILWECIPHGKGYEQNNHWQAKGETYMSTKGLMGFQSRDQNIVFCHMWPGGGISWDVGKFVSDTKMIWDRYNPQNPNHVSTKIELNFIAADKTKLTFKSRGDKDTWDDAVITENIWIRVKE